MRDERPPLEDPATILQRLPKGWGAQGFAGLRSKLPRGPSRSSKLCSSCDQSWLLDAVKSVRSKALLALGDLLSYEHQHQEDMVIDAPANSDAPAPGTSYAGNGLQDALDLVASTKQMAENVLELIGHALGDQRMLQLILSLLHNGTRPGRHSGSCPGRTPSMPCEDGVVAAGTAAELNTSGQNQPHHYQQQHQLLLNGGMPPVSASPMLVAVLLARFVPSSMSVAYEAWGLHVEGISSREQLKSLARTMEAAPSTMRRALYEEAFRSICTTLGHQQQQQQQQQQGQGCTELGSEELLLGAIANLQRAAKLVFCLGRSRSLNLDKGVAYSHPGRQSKQQSQNPQQQQQKQQRQHQHHQQQQQQHQQQHKLQQDRSDAIGEVAILADSIGFLLECLGHKAQRQQGKLQQQQQQQCRSSAALALPTSLTSQLLHALCWCMCALQQVLVSQGAQASQALGAGQHEWTLSAAPQHRTESSAPNCVSAAAAAAAATPAAALAAATPASAPAAAAAAAQQPRTLAMKLVVWCLPDLLQLCRACAHTPEQRNELKSSAAAWQEEGRGVGVDEEVGERNAGADGLAAAAAAAATAATAADPASGITGVAKAEAAATGIATTGAGKPEVTRAMAAMVDTVRAGTKMADTAVVETATTERATAEAAKAGTAKVNTATVAVPAAAPAEVAMADTAAMAEMATAEAATAGAAKAGKAMAKTAVPAAATTEAAMADTAVTETAMAEAAKVNTAMAKTAMTAVPPTAMAETGMAGTATAETAMAEAAGVDAAIAEVAMAGTVMAQTATPEAAPTSAPEAAMAAVDEALRLLCSCPGGSPYAHCLLHVLEAKLCEASRVGRSDTTAVATSTAAGCVGRDAGGHVSKGSDAGGDAASKGAGGQGDTSKLAQPARGKCLALLVDAVEQLDCQSTMAVHIMLLGHMCRFYEAECKEFLARARAAHDHQGRQARDAAAGQVAAASALGHVAQQPQGQCCTCPSIGACDVAAKGGEAREQEKASGAEAMEVDDLPVAEKNQRGAGSGGGGGSGGSSSGGGYGNYMQQQEEERALRELAQQYLDGLMQRTAPASRAPALLAVLGAPPGQCSSFLQVQALKSLTGLMLLSDAQALLYVHVLGSCLRKPLPFTQDAPSSPGSVAAAAETLCAAALDAVEPLMMHRPNASSQLLVHVETLVGGLLQLGSALPGPWLLVRAMVCLARIFASDKLQLSSTTWQVMANCALSSDVKVQEIARHTLCALLLDAKATSSRKAGSTASAQARLIKGVLSLYGNCEAGRRKQLVEKVLLGWPLLREADLASDALVLPVLQSLAVADCKASRAAAVALLAHVCPSTRALASLHALLQGLGIHHLNTEEAHSVLTGLRAFVQQHSTKAAADRASKAARAGDVSASTGTCAKVAVEAMGSELPAIKIEEEEEEDVDVLKHQTALQSFKQQQQQQQQQQRQCADGTLSAKMAESQELKEKMRSISGGKGNTRGKQRAAVKRRMSQI
ncbi:hypothetical protein DUNSADRAFT_5185 [Dunaliella salina]|uniref:Uncharacterized protein n=1 Tax=Dunaliella salina TaxID=3046 RepID=A0ABQ7GQS2_DUNSA|nr:hypothetical protein DUNSADRAFT_5185 [Dunaliella salina]|eukprot:KAF5836956.1 hypothetical protein DUNSADRAFT_5185 [Dunaliella salina]